MPHRHLCNVSNYFTGSWMEGPLKEDFDTCDDFGRNCALKSPEERSRIAHSMRWAWMPTTCDLRLFDVEALLGILDGRRVFFIGDSVNIDMLDSMKCMIKSRMGEVVIHDHFRGIRSDFLGCTKKTHGDRRTSLICEPTEVLVSWKKTVNEHGIRRDDILLINTGAHWYNYNVSHFPTIAHSVKHVHPTGLVLFRTTVMGHANCDQIRAPGKPLDSGPSLYNWKSFDTLNSAFEHAFRDSGFGDQFHVLHVNMFEERGDGHVGGSPPDCLHYCVPGSIDVWNILLYNLLAAIKQQGT
jgi:hypothetical protein